MIANGFCAVTMTYVEPYFRGDGMLGGGKCAGSSSPEEMLLKLAVKNLLQMRPSRSITM